MDNFLDKLFNQWEKLYFTAFLWFVCAIFAFIAGLKNYQKEIVYKSFLLYALSNILLMTVTYDFLIIYFNINSIERHILGETTNILFALIEMSVFLLFFKRAFNNKAITKTITVVWFGFTVLCLYDIYKFIFTKQQPNSIHNLGYFTVVVELMISSLLCLLYFYNILSSQTKTETDLATSPSFWITSGLFFYCIISLPTLLIGTKLILLNPRLHYIMGAVHYTSISILLLCILKAFQCKKILTT